MVTIQKDGGVIIQQQNIRVLKGAAYGVRSAIIVSNIKISKTTGVNWTLLGEEMSTCFELKQETSKSLQPEDAIKKTMRCLHVLQYQAGLPVFEEGKILSSRVINKNVYKAEVALPYFHLQSTLDTLNWIISSVNSLIKAKNKQEKNNCIESIRLSLVKRKRVLTRVAPSGSNSLRFLKAAHEHNIPWRLLTDNVFEFGQGVYARWLESSFSDQTSVIGARLARNKQLTANVLSKAGLPVAAHFQVSTPEAAVKGALKLGFPVVIKPMDKDRGLGVAAGLINEVEVQKAFLAARKFSKKILVEKHIEGRDYRLTVVNGEMIWAVYRRPGGVVGDGLSTISELVEMVNLDQKRGSAFNSPLKILVLNNEAFDLLSRLGLTVDHIPKQGEFIALRRIANINSGGLPLAITDKVHPDNKRLAERAAASVKLDIAGVDLIIPDISQSWLKVQSAICEVNAQPQLGYTTNTHIYADILNQLLRGNGQIPIVLFVGTILAPKVAKQLGALWEEAGKQVGIASRGGVYRNDNNVALVDGFFAAGQAALADKEVEAVILFASIDEIVNSGLPFVRCDAVVMLEENPKSSRFFTACRMLFQQAIGALIINENDERVANYVAKMSVAEIVYIPVDGDSKDEAFVKRQAKNITQIISRYIEL